MTSNDKTLITSILTDTAVRTGGGTIPASDALLAAVAGALASKDPDLREMGLYVSSRLEQNVLTNQILPTPDFAEPITRYLTSELMAERHSAHERFAAAAVPDSETLSAAFRGRYRDYPHLITQFDNTQGHYVAAHCAAPAKALSAAADTAGRPLALIVHGTWAASETWWRDDPTSNFWAYVHEKWTHLYRGDSPFSWSGADSHSARVQGAKDLIAWLNRQTYSEVDIITHSHGGNVCFWATRLGLRIRTLITLGTPMRIEYLPDLRQVGALHNVFSGGDRVQTPFGTIPSCRGEGRTLGDSGNVINYWADDNGSGSAPGHSELHEGMTWESSGLSVLLDP